MVVLDTCFLIDLMRGHQKEVAMLNQLLESPAPLGVSAITVMELHAGVTRSAVPSSTRHKVVEALEGLNVEPITREIAAMAGELEGLLSKAGKTLDPLDLLIGATALHLDEPLVTRNLRHFQRLEGLKVLGY